MKNIKNFDEFLNENINNLFDEIKIEIEPYEESQFRQGKYRVFIINDDKTYYIGDLRKFNSNNEFLSYLNLDKIKLQKPQFDLINLTDEQMDIVNKELNRLCLTSNLMDDHISYREKLKKDLNINL